MIASIHEFLAMLNKMMYKTHNLYLDTIDFEIKSCDGNDDFIVEIQLDKDLGRVQVALDPDYDRQKEKELNSFNEEKLHTLNAAEEFDINIQATHCTTWALKSKFQNDSLIDIIKSDQNNPVGIL